MPQDQTLEQEVQLAINALDDRRARDVTVLNLHEVSESLDYFIIATGESTLQLKALEEAVKEAFKSAGQYPKAIEGPSDRWILMDYGAIVVHLMNREAREFYDLEGLWADAETVEFTPD